jgi:tryptophanyl-tRNA synthetase
MEQERRRKRMAQAGKERVVSGIQPTGELHIGNFFGAVRNWLSLQERYDCVFFIADYHAITVEHDPDLLRRRVQELAATLLACGLDPERSILMIQSHVPEHTELAWVFNCLTSFGDLTRMTQFKDRSQREEFISAGLFDYPVLQAADILIYHGRKVPVGRDQVQHIELTRRIARRFNARFGEYFPEPEALLTEAASIKSPANPEKEMSKSLGPKHYIGLLEPEDAIWEKIKTAVTDVGPRGPEMSPGVANLFLLLKLTAPEEVYRSFQAEYDRGTLRYAKLKEAVFEHLMETLRPIRERRAQLSAGDVRTVFEEGSRRAREIAQATLQEVRSRIGIR